MIETEYYIDLGAQLRALRESGPKTREDIAAKFGKHVSYIGMIERGEKPISSALLNQWVDFLGGLLSMENGQTRIYKKPGA